MYIILGLTFEPKCPNEPTKLVVKCCIHLLRCLTIGLRIHSTSIHSQSSKLLASHLLPILSSSFKG